MRSDWTKMLGIVRSLSWVKWTGNHFITSGNAMLTEEVDDMISRLEKINSLDKAGLKEMYRDKIRTTKISEKGGAGLGFIDMAKKSGNKLSFHFEKMDEIHSFFSLKIVIN